MERTGIGFCAASFGELLQGVLPGQRKFLVNLRIRRGSRVRVRLTSPLYSAEKEAQIASSYQSYPKSYKLLRNTLSDLGSHDDCLIEIESDVPVGKGLSSSTADMVAAIRGLANAASVAFREDYIGRVITEIEPNDGLQYQGTSAYHHTTGQLIERVDWVPPFRILGVDFGGIVDTVTFNQKKIEFSAAQMDRYHSLLRDMLGALRSHESDAVAAIASESTRLWQTFRPRAEMEKMFELQAATGGLGVVNTHSGTYLGLLFDPGRDDWEDIRESVCATFPGKESDWFDTLYPENGRE
jgi:uncharacterized protein involved in propanediol utilization